MVINAELGINLIRIFGFINIITILIVFFSCRCMVGIKFVNAMWKYKWYQKYYNKHCYYWVAFYVSVLIHFILVLIVFGLPF